MKASQCIPHKQFSNFMSVMREEVLNSRQFIKLQKVKVKADRAFGICRCITAHILSEETKDMGSIGYCLNLFSKKKKKKKKNIYIYIYIYPLWLIYVVKK